MKKKDVQKPNKRAVLKEKTKKSAARAERSLSLVQTMSIPGFGELVLIPVPVGSPGWVSNILAPLVLGELSRLNDKLEIAVRRGDEAEVKDLSVRILTGAAHVQTVLPTVPPSVTELVEKTMTLLATGCAGRADGSAQ